MPDRQQVIETMKEALESRTYMSLKVDEIGEDTSLIDDLGLDSFAILQLVTALEESFSIKIDSDDFELSLFRSVGKLVDLVLEKHGDND